jgi:hypothetical protein
MPVMPRRAVVLAATGVLLGVAAGVVTGLLAGVLPGLVVGAVGALVAGPLGAVVGTLPLGMAGVVAPDTAAGASGARGPAGDEPEAGDAARQR